MALALSLGLVPDEARARIQKDLRKKIADRQDHLDTGFVGTRITSAPRCPRTVCPTWPTPFC